MIGRSRPDVMAAITAAIAGGAQFPKMLEGAEFHPPARPTKAEAIWMEGLPAFRLDHWKKRFARGLSAGERAYVNEQVRE